MTVVAHVRRDARTRVRGALAALLPVCLLVTGGCAATSDPGAPAPRGAADQACLVVPPGGVGIGGRPDLARAPVVVGLPGPVDPHALLPRTPAERFLSAQLFETLVRVDCEGRTEPGLAASWSVEGEGRRWTFHLRPDALSGRGGAVTASTVASSWLRTQDAGRRDPARGGVQGEAPSPVLTRVMVVDSRTLRVELAEPVHAEHFARPELAVRTGVDEAGWPIGSGPYRIASTADGPPASGPLPPSVDLAGPAAVELRTVSGDGRNALDEGVELLVTSDPAVIEYARQLPAYTTYPLSWDRTYLLASRAVDPAGAPDGTGVPDPTDGPTVLQAPAAALEGLARDAVRVEARAATTPPEREACAAREPTGRPAAAGGTRAARIVYPAGDAVARSLAERLVALALDPSRPEASWLAQGLPDPGGSGGRLQAAGLSEAAFAGALRSGRDAAYVLPVQGTGCGTVSAAVRAAPWLHAGSDEPAGDRTPAVLPLIETRSTLVVRRGIGGVSVDGLGTLRLDGLHRFDPEGGR